MQSLNLALVDYIGAILILMRTILLGSTRQKVKLMFYVDFPTKEIKSMITEQLC